MEVFGQRAGDVLPRGLYNASLLLYYLGMAKGSSETKPEKRLLLPKWSMPAIFCMLAFQVASLFYDCGFSSYDDGVAAEGARLVLHGKVPYSDFWTIYSPGSFYANALGLAVLGERLISIRALGLLQAILQALLVYGILRRTARAAWAMVASGALFLALMPLGALTWWFTIAMAAAYCLARAIEQPESRWTYACGLGIGIAALFRQDVGAYLALAALLLIYAAAHGSSRERTAPVLRALGATAAMIVAAVAYLSAKGALVPMIEQAVRFAIVEYPGSRPTPYPIPWREVLVIGSYSAPVSISMLYQLYGFYLMPAILLVIGGLSVHRKAKEGGDRREVVATSLIWLALAMFLMVRVRPSGARILMSAALSGIAMAGLVTSRNRAVRTGAAAGLVLSLAAFIPFGAYTIWAQRSYATSAISGRGRVYAAKGPSEYLSVVSSRIRALTSPSEKILAGAPIIYFLSDRDPVTRDYEPHPRMTDTAYTQHDIIRDIEKNHMRFFVRSREWGMDSYFTIEPTNQPRILIDYIERNYKVREDYTIFQIYERKTPFAH